MPRPKKQPESKALAVIPKTHLGRRCSICFHLEVKRINKLIRKGDSFRAISRQIIYDDSIRHSIRRHAENCLRFDLRAMIEEKRIDQAVEHYKELIKLLDFSQELKEALEILLRDSKTGKITFAPRDYEIEVLYVDHADTDLITGLPKRKKEKLSDIILNIQQIRSGFAYQNVQIKAINYFDASLQVIKTIDLLLDKFAKVDGHYQKERENDETIKRVIRGVLNWLENHQDATVTEQRLAIAKFAELSGIEAEQIAQRVGIELE